MSVLELAQGLPPRSFRSVTWREGVTGPLSSCFARVRVRAAHADRPRAEEWLLIELPQGEPEPTHYWLSTLAPGSSLKHLVASAKARWMIERDYEEFKSELGLHHFEGRGWRGFHHHASLCIAAYGFLMLERARGRGKKTPLDSKNLLYPAASARTGLAPMQRHIPWSIATMCYRLARAIARSLPQCPCCGLHNVNGARRF